MDGKQFQTRSRVVLLSLAAVLLVFTGVLYNLQIVNGAKFLEQSTRKIVNTETVQAARGEILDRYGRVLVTNRASYQVSLNTGLMGTVAERNDTILELLRLCREQDMTWTDNLPVTDTPPLPLHRGQPLRDGEPG